MPDVSTSDTFTVELGPRSYDIQIGENELNGLGARIAPLAPSRRICVVTDETVYSLHGKALEKALENYQLHLIIRPVGEAQKSMANLEEVLDGLFEAELDRSDLIIAFGGGVIGDLTGFAASIYKRGAPFIQIPTTLLAQVDSSVGGKTAINNRFGKNLIGAFYQPRLVLTDISFLHTLPPRQLKAGYAEIVKYGLLGDRGFFAQLEAGLGDKLLQLDPAALTQAIHKSCAAKARIVAADEREAGERALLNLGHTFAHALELAAGYGGDLLHGEAVSVGMEMAFEFSAAQGLCPLEDAQLVSQHLARLGMPRIADMGPLLQDPDALLSHMGQDKKNEGGQLTLILVRGIGDAFIEKNADATAVLNYLVQLKDNA